MHKKFFIRSFIGVLILVIIGLVTFGSPFASASQINDRKITISSSAPSATGVNYTFNASALPTTGSAIKSVKVLFCTTASGSCTTPSGFSALSSTLGSQPTGLGSASGWTVNASVAGELRVINASNSTNPSGSVSIAWGGVVNPSAANTTYYGRITTYTGSDWSTGPTDTGTVALSTSQSISLTGVVDETLTFCTGTSISGQNCGTVAGNSVNFGTFSASSTSSGTSVMAAGTNASSGYIITINGSTMTSGLNTITALASQAATSVGTEQFGLNLRANTTPSAGTDPTGGGTGSYTANYGTANQFRFVTGDTVASVSTGTLMNTYTATYIVNISTATEAGTYTAAMNYICTATF